MKYEKIVSFISIALVALMLAAMFAACGDSNNQQGKTESQEENSDSPEGKYYTKSIDGQPVDDALKAVAEQQGITIEKLFKSASINSAEEFYTIELQSDGKAVIETHGGKVEESIDSEETENETWIFCPVTMAGEWKQNGDKIEITLTDSTETVSYTKNGNEQRNDEGDTKYVYAKKTRE